MSARRFKGIVFLCVVCALIGCGNPQGLDSVATMSARRFKGIVFLCVVCALIGCGNPQGLDSVAVSPSRTDSESKGSRCNFTATGTFGNANHASTQNITGSVNWTSSLPTVATVSAAGVATAVSSGATTITASTQGYNGPVSSSAVLTVPGTTTTVGNGGGSGAGILSLTIIPSGIVFGELTQSGQFLAIATYSNAPTVRGRHKTRSTWLTSEPNKFPVDQLQPDGMPGGGTQNGGVVRALIRPAADLLAL